ncbi:outer membrane protein [Prosthecomicrobium pneumaticum]|uniref:Outer membrane immunogenic protein n=1 Tax=Prosthecomicrobium pneumaticum TaxID=81895 RepID=A0A7W9FMW6_9HYPH|nr:outer membrane protein [Prosthecomicrobium pneumaticum]MBB5753642.1 outer membrane immunogenic protein [Prosthecomicrobium pneumaticum]
MKKLLLAGAASLALTGAAAAADLTYEAPPAVAPAPVISSSVFNWSGFYAGVHGGWGWTTADVDSFGDVDGDGFLVGVQGGYNWQMDQFVFGLETDFSYADISGSEAGFDGDLNWLGTTTGRIGYAMDNVLVYAKGGVAYGEGEADSGVADESNWHVGWTAGAGLEYGFTQNVTGRLEYSYVDLGSENYLGTDVDFTTHIVKAGLNFKF